MTTNFVSSFFSVAHAIGMLPGLFLPYIIGIILQAGNCLRTQWSIVWYMVGSSTVVSLALFYLVRCEIQSWDKVDVVVDEHVVKFENNKNFKMRV